MKAIKVIGDHSDVHCGCRAVMSVIYKSLPADVILTDGDNFDILVVNGEGSMHHTTGPCRKKMKEMHSAVQLGKRVFLINSVWQENTTQFNETLRCIEKIYTRECMSRDDLLRRHGIDSEVIPDLSLKECLNNDADFIDFNDRPVMTDFYSKEFSAFVRITDGLLRRTRFVDMKKLEWSSLVRSLSTASVLVTGRHHAVMAACKARVPFVALAGNTHKIEGFLKTARINIPVCFHPDELNNVVNWAVVNKSAYEDLFDWVAQLPDWKLDL